MAELPSDTEVLWAMIAERDALILELRERIALLTDVKVRGRYTEAITGRPSSDFPGCVE